MCDHKDVFKDSLVCLGKMTIVFDVGANDGSSTVKLADNSDVTIYAFEPTPHLVEKLRKISEEHPNYIVVDKAVSNVKGRQSFHVAGQADWGCSSLNTFNDNLDETWPGRTDFKVTDIIDVEVIRLDEFIEQHNIPIIDYFHCDVQGKDLEVLMGLGKYIDIVRHGVIEMPTSHVKKLYKDQQYVAEDAIQWLQHHGFEITNVMQNDVFNNEVNIVFRRRFF